MIQVSSPKETKKNTKAERIIFKNTTLKLPIVSETNLPYVDDASEVVDLTSRVDNEENEELILEDLEAVESSVTDIVSKSNLIKNDILDDLESKSQGLI